MATHPLDAVDGISEDRFKPLGISSVRAHLIATVAQTGPSTATDLMAELGIGRSALAAHTAVLEQSGILRAAPDPQRQGATGGGFNRLVWTVDRQALAGMLHELERTLLGGEEPPQ